MPTLVLYPNVFDLLHIFPPDIFFTSQAEDNYSGLHIICVVMKLKELLHPKYPSLFIFQLLHISIQSRWLCFLKFTWKVSPITPLIRMITMTIIIPLRPRTRIILVSSPLLSGVSNNLPSITVLSLSDL